MSASGPSGPLVFLTIMFVKYVYDHDNDNGSSCWSFRSQRRLIQETTVLFRV